MNNKEDEALRILKRMIDNEDAEYEPTTYKTTWHEILKQSRALLAKRPAPDDDAASAMEAALTVLSPKSYEYWRVLNALLKMQAKP